MTAPVYRPQFPAWRGVEALAPAPPPQPERLRYLAGRIHALGPRPLYELFREFDNGAPLSPALERYADLSAYRDFIRALDSANLFAPLPIIDGGWPCVLADPPWRFQSNSETRPGRNARRHYGSLALGQIASLPVKDVVARDAYLWLWIPGPFLVLGAHLLIMRAWGFKPAAMGLVWLKLNRNAPELFFDRRSLFMGPGLTTRKCCEFLVLGRRGRPRRLAKDVLEAMVAPRREHKPDETYQRIERYCAGPRLDLFARERRPGWTSWGDETSRFDPHDEAPASPWLQAAE
jgi:N6-adenosine-specific RNA methylase IME4